MRARMPLSKKQSLPAFRLNNFSRQVGGALASPFAELSTDPVRGGGGGEREEIATYVCG